MSHKSLAAAGWLAMFSAFIALPFAYFIFTLEGKNDQESIIIQGLLQICGTLLFTAITGYLKKFLNMQCTFHDTDRQIYLMIMANIAAATLVLAGLPFPHLKETLGVAALVVVVFQGIIQIQFGYRLQKLPDNLGGLLKPFCYSNMATGICIASVLLILFGVVVSAVSDLMLGTIFLNAAKSAKEIEAGRSDI